MEKKTQENDTAIPVVFNDNPTLDVCFQTSDKKHFFLESDAKNYASNLADKNVKKLVRSDFTKVELQGEEKEVTEAKIDKTKK